MIDVGGATTDVHSITDGSPEISAIQMEPQPHSKRTVEGDLGTYVSARHVARDAQRPASSATTASATATAELTRGRWSRRRSPPWRASRPSPRCSVTPGQLAHLYTPTGRQTVARGRDLTACRLVIGTGGALTRLPGGAVDPRRLTRG